MTLHLQLDEWNQKWYQPQHAFCSLFPCFRSYCAQKTIKLSKMIKTCSDSKMTFLLYVFYICIILFIVAYNILFHMLYSTIFLTNCSQWTMFSILHTMQETVCYCFIQSIGRALDIKDSWEITTETNIQTQKKKENTRWKKNQMLWLNHILSVSAGLMSWGMALIRVYGSLVCCTCNALPCSIRGTQETSRACNMLYRSWISDALVCEDHSASHPTGPASH